jgi:phosphatidylserine/phosphatidylglycerophosphate/cardiolipin synthase-like enzyme
MKKRHITLILFMLTLISIPPVLGQTETEWEYLAYQIADGTTPTVYPDYDGLSTLLEESCTGYSDREQLTICHFDVLGEMGWELVDINNLGVYYFKRVTTQEPAIFEDNSVIVIPIEAGFGAEIRFWQVYFTAPSGSSDESTYVGGIDDHLIVAIGEVQNTLDIAAFEWNNPWLTDAVIAAYQRGVAVRMVVDNEYTVADNQEAVDLGEESPFQEIIDAGIPFVDDDRGGLMHNKFMILDGKTVWMGSMNFTMNGIYRNNNNMLVLSVPQAVKAYQGEFDEMFVDGQFGSPRSDIDGVSFSQDGVEVQIIFAPEDEPEVVLQDALANAQTSIRFMTFSFTLDEIGETVLERAENGVDVRGIFEQRGSDTQFSEMPGLFCAGVSVYQDGNSRTFHHKVFIIDEEVVITGSFNISSNATSSNDENMVIIHDADLAAQYLAEYARMESMASVPDVGDITCP